MAGRIRSHLVPQGRAGGRTTTGPGISVKWASAASDEPRLDRAIPSVLSATRARLGSADPDLLVVFVSDHHQGGYEAVSRRLAEECPGALVVGCSGRSVIGGGREIEDGAGFALVAATLPDVALRPFHLTQDSIPDPKGDGAQWPDLVGVAPEQQPHFILLADPLSTDPERALRGLDVSFPDSVKIGGLASGASELVANALFLGDAVHRSGLVGVALCGDLTIDAIVAQGCRPIGHPMFVTRCAGNMLHELDGRPPLEVINELYETANARDQELFRTSLFMGLEMKASRSEYHRGDFLIRNLLDAEQETGSLLIAASLRETQVAQFHLRDARTAAEDLEHQLTRYADEKRAACGALLFSCLGRGQHLYEERDHDSNAFRRHLGDLPLGGFFCNGEIGPVEDQTFLHGYTSVFGLFRPRNPVEPAS